ncbi:PQQ-binding-like beta-propeller repeat protein [Streptomyces sp. NRRL WC-3742]|uniref:outer membrane protein assembly factor BamB family protein n=1 Tax=Streptomyces sp. NRRL WC-3742 TaxID=1463934 RepID=UPI0004C8E4C6|nr:PQQ-binding-like beta-propeller repeat protein [Streptomyces sp. NRRL WC-3742]
MAGDQPTPGAGDAPGNGPQDNRGVSFGRQPAGVDPAAVADQMTQLDGAAVPGQAAPAQPPVPPAQPPAPPVQPPAGAEYAAYAPTAAGFPSQAPPPAGAPVGPYDPMPGGYGAPDPNQQGYGAYGYPQQQPGYGFPGAPVPPAPKQRNPVMLWGGIIGGVLAIAIVIGLVVLFQKKDDPDTTAGGTTGGSTSAGTNAGTNAGPANNSPTTDTKGGTGGSYGIAWNAAKAANSDSSSQMLALWGTDKVVVRVDNTGIRAFNTSDGKDAWTIPVPSGGKEFCAASYGTNTKNLGAIAVNTGDYDCSTVGVVDVAQGKITWTVKANAERLSSPTLSITDKVVAFAGNAVGGLNIDNGSPVWTYQQRAKICSVTARAAGANIAISDRCYDDNIQKSLLQVVNSENGSAVGGQIPLSGSIERIDKVIQEQPLVLLMASGPNGDYILPFDKDFKPGNQMSTKEPGSDSLRLSGRSDAFTQNVVSGTTMYVQVGGGKSGINAYDLTTGKRLWSTTSSGSSNDMRLVSGTDKQGKVRAIVSQGYNKPAKLVTLSPTDGSTTDLGTLASGNGMDIVSMAEYVISDEGNSVYAFRRYSSDAPVTKWKK